MKFIYEAKYFSFTWEFTGMPRFEKEVKFFTQIFFTRSGSRRISTGDLTRNAPKYLSSLNHSYISFIPSGKDFRNNNMGAKFPNNTVGFRKGTPRFFQKSNVEVRKQYKIPRNNPGKRNCSNNSLIMFHILSSIEFLELFIILHLYDYLLWIWYL